MGIEEKVDMLRWELAVVVVMLLILMYSAAVTGSLYLPGYTHNTTTASGNMLIEGMRNLKSPQKRGGLGHADKKGAHKSAKRAPMIKRGAQKSGFAAYTINGADPFSDGIDTIGGTFVNTSMLF